MTIFFQSSSMMIGKHEWRVRVISTRYHGRCTEYQYRRLGESQWHAERAWPSYNGNDTYLGMPRSLNRLYQSYRGDIQAALDGLPMPQQNLPL